MARPSSYNPEIVRRIVADVAAGVPKTSAFETNGVSPRTVFYWQRRYPEFARAVADAQARFARRTATASARYPR